LAPKEPWLYGDAFLAGFRATIAMRYRLMPYLFAQAKDSSQHGLPMLRALFLEFPDDPGSWQIDDSYLLGSSLLVAPLLHGGERTRDVYLPPGQWTDYQSGKRYGPGWHRLTAGDVPGIILVREGTILPHMNLAQSTSQLDWSRLHLEVYPTSAGTATGLIFRPEDAQPAAIAVTTTEQGARLVADPWKGAVTWTIQTGPGSRR